MAEVASTTSTTRRRLAVAVIGTLALVGVIGACSRAPERSAEAFCGQVRDVEDIDEVLASGDAARTSDELTGLRRLAEVSPPEVEPHVGTLVRITDELATEMARAGDPARAADEVFARHRSDLPAISEAGTAVERYATDHCQVTLNPTATAPAPTATEVPTTTAPTSSTSAPKSSTTTSTTRRSSSSSTRSTGTSTTRRSTTTSTTRRVTTTR